MIDGDFGADEDPLDLGHIVILLLTSTLAGLSERLAYDGFQSAAELVADLVEVCDCYLVRRDRELHGRAV